MAQGILAQALVPVPWKSLILGDSVEYLSAACRVPSVPPVPVVMTDESTVPFGVNAGGVGKIDVSDDDDDAPGDESLEKGGDTALDASQRLLHEAAAREPRLNVIDGRGRPREREGVRERETGRPRPHPKPSPGVRLPASPTERELEDAAIAAEALAAAMRCAPAPEGGHSLDSVRYLNAGLPDRNLSPEKRARTTANKAPHFGAFPPVFHGPAVTPRGEAPLGGTEARLMEVEPRHPQVNPPQVTASGPERYNLDPEPTWIAALRQELQDIGSTQRQMSAQLTDSGHELRKLREGILHLGQGQEALTKRADEQEQALAKMQRDLRDLEKELQAVKSAPRYAQCGTPRQGGGESEVDELQVVIGGWREARREDIELEVQTMFEGIRGSALLKRVYVPYVRCGFCRCELVYPEPDIWKQRKLQGVVVQALKDLQYTSQIRGQEGCKFWAARNRSQAERAKIRAILSTRDLCVRHLGEHLVDKDWRGKLWANQVQILHHVEYRDRAHNTLMLVDAKGNESGWFLDVDQVAAVLGVEQEVVLRHFDAH